MEVRVDGGLGIVQWCKVSYLCGWSTPSTLCSTPSSRMVAV